MKIIMTQKPGPGGDVRGEGESSTSDSQDPTDGSYIMDMESCNIWPPEKLVDKLTKIPNGYKSGIPWSIKPVKVPLIKMEDGSPFDIWNWKLSTRPWPRLNCQNILFLERRPQLLRAGRRRDKNSILICHFWFRRTLSRIGSALHIFIEL